MLWTFFGTYFGRYLYVFCTSSVCYGHSLGHILYVFCMLWTFFGHILDVICMFFVHLLYVMDILWDIFWTLFVCMYLDHMHYLFLTMKSLVQASIVSKEITFSALLSCGSDLQDLFGDRVLSESGENQRGMRII